MCIQFFFVTIETDLLNYMSLYCNILDRRSKDCALLDRQRISEKKPDIGLEFIYIIAQTSVVNNGSEISCVKKRRFNRASGYQRFSPTAFLLITSVLDGHFGSHCCQKILSGLKLVRDFESEAYKRFY